MEDARVRLWLFPGSFVLAKVWRPLQSYGCVLAGCPGDPDQHDVTEHQQLLPADTPAAMSSLPAAQRHTLTVSDLLFFADSKSKQRVYPPKQDEEDITAELTQPIKVENQNYSDSDPKTK